MCERREGVMRCVCGGEVGPYAAVLPSQIVGYLEVGWWEQGIEVCSAFSRTLVSVVIGVGPEGLEAFLWLDSHRFN